MDLAVEPQTLVNLTAPIWNNANNAFPLKVVTSNLDITSAVSV
jgi:flagellar assembly factor FliW